MTNVKRTGWRLMVAAASLSAAAAGVGIAFADTATSMPAGGANAVSPANHAAAVAEFEKARGLYNAEKYPEANAENDKALKLEPGFAEAGMMRTMIQRKINEAPAGAAGGAGSAGGAATGPGGEKSALLKPADVTLLKVGEWSAESDAKLHGRVARKTLDDFWDNVVKKNDATATREQHDAFVNGSNFAEQVKKIKASGDTQYMDKIEFSGDPAALNSYRKSVQPYVLQNCATATCHAGDNAGNFKLVHSTNNVGDQSLYTNFYILSMYADKAGNKMIDRDFPEKSLLLQYGMVKKNAATPHPGKVELHFFTDKSDTKFVTMTDWIKTLSFPRPNYGIVYELPGTEATAAPAPTTQKAPPATMKKPPAGPTGVMQKGR